MNDTAAAASANCLHSESMHWPHTQCVASVLQGAASLATPSHGCPPRLQDTFRGSFGWNGPATEAMQCTDDGRHAMPGQPHVARNALFNRSSAFGVTRGVCQTFTWARAKAARQERQIHAGPALLGTDRDLGRVLSSGRAGRFSLMNLGSTPSAYS